MEVAQPLCRAEVGEPTFDNSGTRFALEAPGASHGSGRRTGLSYVGYAADASAGRCPKGRQYFYEGSETLGRPIEHAVLALGVVEPPAADEGSVGKYPGAITMRYAP